MQPKIKTARQWRRKKVEGSEAKGGKIYFPAFLLFFYLGA